MDSTPCRGAGLGLRPAHLMEVISRKPDVPWFEVHICNYLGGGMSRELLRQVADRYPLSFHGVNMNLGGVDPLDSYYLNELKRAIDEFQPALVSEHLCFNTHNGRYFHDLLPIPHTSEAVRHIAARIRQVQDTLERTLLIENISRYFEYPEHEVSEGEFLSAIAEEAGCYLILDLTNAWINQQNLHQPLETLLTELPLDRVQEVHLAGVGGTDGQLIDSHSSAPDEKIWQLYRSFSELKPNVPCLIEWDEKLPPLDQLLSLQQIAQSIHSELGTPCAHREAMV